MSLMLPPRLTALGERLKELRRAKKILLQNGDCGYASAPSNIALLKYWGKVQGQSQIPENSSLSFTLGGFRSFTKIEVVGRFFPEPLPANFSRPAFKIKLNNSIGYEDVSAKMHDFLLELTESFGPDIGFKITTNNNFPTACGIASSASGFAAVVGAIADLLQLHKHFEEKELTYWLAEWARLGSGSATRSTILTQEPHFGAWELEKNHSGDEFSTLTFKAHASKELALALKHFVIVVNEHPKKFSSSDGHALAKTSILYALRKAHLEGLYKTALTALRSGDFETLKNLAERDAFNMHAVMQTSSPSLSYLEPKTIEILQAFIAFRDANDIDAFWTLDAGPNIHICYLEKEKEKLQAYFTAEHPSLSFLSGLSNAGLLLGLEYFNEFCQVPLLQKGI